MTFIPCTSFMIFVIQCPLPPSNVMFVLFSLSVLESVWLIPSDFFSFQLLVFLLLLLQLSARCGE